jgi:transitional endoplasmic reticulum ATPase
MIMGKFFSGYDRYGTFNLFTESGDLSSELERLLYTYARNLLGRHRLSVEFTFFLLDLIPEAVRRNIVERLVDLTTNTQSGSFRDASSLAQLVMNLTMEHPETDEKITLAFQAHIDEYHQSVKCGSNHDGVLIETARGIQRLFGLSDTDAEILLFLYAVSQFEGLETVWTSHRPHGRSRLIAVATGLDETAVTESLSAGSRMMITGILQTCSSQNNHSVSLTSDVIAAVSHQAPESMKSSYLIEMKPSSLTLDSFAVPDAARRIVGSLIGSTDRHHILVVGRPGLGKTEFIRCISRTTGKTPILYRLQSDSTAAIEFRRITAASCLIDTDGEILVLDECDHILNSRAVFAGNSDTITKGKINAFLDSSECGTIWIVNDADYLDSSVRRRFSYILDYPRPSLRQRAKLWSTIVSRRTETSISTNTIEKLAHRYPVSTGEFTSALAVVDSLNTDTNGSLDDESIMEEVLRTRVPAAGSPGTGKLEELINDTYDPTVLRTEPDLQRLTGALTGRHAREGDSRIQARLLFHGPPGTGKTRFAKHLADRLDMDLMSVTAADLLSEFVGRTEKSIAAVFHQAQAQDAVLLLDEVDSILSDRTAAIRSWERTQVNQLLTELESYQGIVIACTNLTAILDRAVLRRFDAKVEFKPLDPSGATTLFRRYFPDAELTSRSIDALTSIRELTPGDFVTAFRRIRFSQPDAHADEIIQMLADEVQQRDVGRQRRIGFGST